MGAWNRGLGTLVTRIGLPYERSMHERTVYPGTLTYDGTVPNIELLSPLSVRRSTTGRGECRTDGFWGYGPEWTILLHGAESRGYGECL